LKNGGVWAQECLSSKTKKVAFVSNLKIFRLYGKAIINSFEKQGFQTHVFLMKDGEKYKNLRTLESLLKFFGENKLTRTDAVVALGGGVVGDLAGFAAAIFLRGLAFLQIPTTLLAMIDSSVGGKTGVNSSFGKNLIGAFHQPHGVLIDVETLKTLPQRELTAGFCEAVKQAVIADQNLFDQTAEFTKNFPLSKFKGSFTDQKFVEALKSLIAAQIAFKAKIVMQDEREDMERSDGKSRKILNFGHTLAHALEKVTDYKRFKHGEAVGYGIMFAAELSKKLEILGENELDLLNDVLHRLGELPNSQDIPFEKVFAAFAFDKKVIGKSLQWILLQDIGKPIIVDNKDIPPAAINETLKKILQI
jgi:3-dehydroquinate synthase